MCAAICKIVINKRLINTYRCGDHEVRLLLPFDVTQRAFKTYLDLPRLLRSMYVEIEEFVGGKRNRLDGDDAFGRETEILLYLFPELGDTEVRLAEYFV